MLQGLLGALTLRMNKTAYKIGETPTYSISGGPPNSTIAWTSYLDGQSTGEYQAQYGQFTDANGEAVLVGGGPWTADLIGAWEKQVLVVGPDGSFHNGRVVFSVSEDGSPIAPPPPPPLVPLGSSGSSSGSSSNSSGVGDFFGGDFDLPVIGPVPKVAALGGGALLLFFVMSSRGGKR